MPICTNPECITPFCTGCDYTTENPRWLDDSIQFPRLLSEINGMGLTSAQLEALCESMDLTLSELDSLFDRAETAWLRIKEQE